MVLAGLERETAMRGLETEDAAEAGGNANAAATVAAETDGDEAGAYSVAGSRGAAACVVVGVVRVPGSAVDRVVAGGVETELVHGELAEDNGARLLQLAHTPGGDGIFLVDSSRVDVLRTEVGFVAVDVVLVLDSGGNAIQGSEGASFLVPLRRSPCRSQNFLNLAVEPC